jgi:hypothetical protein
MMTYSTKFFAFILLLISTFGLKAQVQVGDDIVGLDQGDQYGSDVDISNDGLRIISSASNGENSDGSSLAGYLTVFEFVNGSWVQLGQLLDGDALADQFGVSAVISGDGTTIGAGAPFNDINGTSGGLARIYRLVDGTWVQVGQDLFSQPQNQLGTSMDISNDGNIVAIGTVRSFRVFQNVNDTWEPLGDEVFATMANSGFGRTISLSDDGMRLAVGAPFNDDDFNNGGQVQVYDFVDGSWIQVGQDINGDSVGLAIGNDDSVSLSGDGSVLAIGFSRANINNENSVGEARIYTLDATNNWEVRDVVTGDDDGDIFGFSLSLNTDGQELIVSAPTTIGSNGFARYFRNEGNGYEQVFVDIENPSDTGRRVSLSDNGFVVIGFPFASANGSTPGIARVFDLNEELLNLNDNEQATAFTLFPNPSNNHLTLQWDGDLGSVQVNIYNMLGQLVLSSDTAQEIDISSLQSGSYVVSLVSDQGPISRIFIKE